MILQLVLNTSKKSWQSFWAFRKRMKEKAEFSADVAIARNELKELGLELNALKNLFSGSLEVKSWQKDIVDAQKSLRPATHESLNEVEKNLKSWTKAIKEFTKGRAGELKTQFDSEGIEDFAQSYKVLNRDLSDLNLVTALKSSKLLDKLRKGLILELTSLNERYNSLTRARDKNAIRLKTLMPRDLLKASEEHYRRLSGFEDIVKSFADLEKQIAEIMSWKGFIEKFERLYKEFPVEAFKNLDDRLSNELKEKKRKVLKDIEQWQTLLDSTELTVREAKNSNTSFSNDWDSEAQEEVWEDSIGSNIEDAEQEEAPIDDDVETRSYAKENAKVGALELQLPPYDLLEEVEKNPQDPILLAKELQDRVKRIDQTLENFKLQGRVVASVRGPSVTRFEVEPAPGEKITRFANLSDDLALAMAVGRLRIEAPIMGKSVIGLEVPNTTRDLIKFRGVVESKEFKQSKHRLPIVIGKTIDEEMLVADLAKMPHLLIAGSTGSGKSVAVNTLIASLLFGFLPTELRLLMIDPKMVELTPFDGIPHLLRPVVTNPNNAAGVLLGAVAHMERRYQMMRKMGAKNLDQYNEKARNLDMSELPFIVIVIDELADLMITSPKEVESAIMRLAQMARATGMHLVLATQRPSVDILTSLIKVNVPSRMAFAVSSSFDSRTIIGTVGAERLIGNGDMLFHQPGMAKPIRVQGPYISEIEIPRLCDFLRRQYFEDEFIEAYGSDFDPPLINESTATGFVDMKDPKLRDAAEMVVREGHASVSRFQRRLSVGHARAGKLMDTLEDLGVVGPHVGSKSREVLMTSDELEQIFDQAASKSQTQ